MSRRIPATGTVVAINYRTAGRASESLHDSVSKVRHNEVCSIPVKRHRHGPQSAVDGTTVDAGYVPRRRQDDISGVRICDFADP